jgi:hypothetical protein
MKVTVRQGIRCVHEGAVIADGDSGEVPEDVGRLWLKLGWAAGEDSQAEPDEARHAPAKRPARRVSA